MSAFTLELQKMHRAFWQTNESETAQRPQRPAWAGVKVGLDGLAWAGGKARQGCEGCKPAGRCCRFTDHFQDHLLVAPLEEPLF